MEGALKMIRAHGHDVGASKYEVVSLDNSFHGRTLGALSITGQPKYRTDFEPLLPGARFVERNNLAALEAAVNENTAGIVLEFVQGEGGILPVSEAFARKARELSERHNALLVFDEGARARRDLRVCRGMRGCSRAGYSGSEGLARAGWFVLAFASWNGSSGSDVNEN